MPLTETDLMSQHEAQLSPTVPHMDNHDDFKLPHTYPWWSRGSICYHCLGSVCWRHVGRLCCHVSRPVGPWALSSVNFSSPFSTAWWGWSQQCITLWQEQRWACFTPTFKSQLLNNAVLKHPAGNVSCSPWLCIDFYTQLYTLEYLVMSPRQNYR